MKYYFGDKALSGYVRQKINKDGYLSYKGVVHIFGSKVPIYLSIEPEDRYVNGEKLYKVFTYLNPLHEEKKGSWVQVAIKSATAQRLHAIKKIQKVVQNLGVAYEYQKTNEEKNQRIKCRECKKAIRSEWENRLREAIESNVTRQREICKRKVQKLLANRKGNKRKRI